MTRRCTTPKPCKHCGSPFIPSKQRWATCSDACQRIRRNARRADYARRVYKPREWVPTLQTCKTCGISFLPARRHQVYCKADHYRQAPAGERWAVMKRHRQGHS